MSSHREKETSHHDAKDPRKQRRSESIDRKPLITREKSASTAKTSRSRDRGSIQSDRTPIDKQQKRKSEEPKKEKKYAEKERKSSKQDVRPVKRRESLESRVGKSTKVDAIYLKDLLEKKALKSGSEGSSKLGGEKTAKSYHGFEVGRRKEEDEERKSLSRRDRTRTRTLSPTEIKQLLPTKAMVGDGDNGEESQARKQEENEGGGDQEYEDDFEVYDSDFEDESPVNETFVVTPAVTSEVRTPENRTPEHQWKLSIRKKELESVKQSIEKENDMIERRQSLTKSPDSVNTTPKKQSLGLLDFSRDLRKLKEARRAGMRRKRGEHLLSMISLDTISYSILEIPPIPYEDFMKAFGKSNTKQVYVQTNEDDLDEETQTDDIPLTNKWTQNPPEYIGSKKVGSEIPFILTREERLGVGGDVSLEEEITTQIKTQALSNFLSWASQLVLVALERKSGNFLSLENVPNHSKAVAFGDGFANLNFTEIPFLKGRAVTCLCITSSNCGRMLSVHTNKEKMFQKCMICIWSLRELSKPLRLLTASNRIVSCCFGLNQGNLVFAGLSDGSICLWDLREPSAYHSRTNNSPEWSLQSPTYTTAGNLKDVGHSSSIVAVRLLSRSEESSGFGDFTPMQICSLDENGTIIIWTVVQLEKPQRSAPSDDLGLAHWGRVKLVKSSSFCVFASLRDEIPGLYITCKDILINEAEDDGFYIANSLGSVHHCSSYGTPMKPKFYVPAKQDAIIETTCLELCPFNGNYFLVGCGDGTIRLHSRHQENPLICLNSNILEDEKEAPIVSLSWMRMRPCVFFALDSMSRINIWDLGASDMYPEVSLILTEKKITCMRLLPISDPRQVPFIVLGTESGSIEIHKLKTRYGCRTVNEVQNEMKMFLKYVSIL